MKAILSLLVIFGTTSVFAQSAEIRAEYQAAMAVKKFHEKQFCEQNPENCKLKSEIEQLQNYRARLKNEYSNEQTAINFQVCFDSAVRQGERATIDGQGIKFVSGTPCNQIREVQEKLPAHVTRASKLATQIKATDSVIAEKQAQLAQMDQK
jgi:hypothetical protein